MNRSWAEVVNSYVQSVSGLFGEYLCDCAWMDARDAMVFPDYDDSWKQAIEIWS